MQTLSDIAEFEHVRRQYSGLVLLIGGRDCSVCETLKPKIETLLKQTFPAMKLVYVDCHQGGERLCAQLGVFSLPVIRLFFDGKEFGELSRVFSLADIRELIARPYQLYFG